MRSGGDDLIGISVANPREGRRLAKRLRDSTVWLEVVAGIDSVVVQFDVARITRQTVEHAITDAIKAAPEESESRDKTVAIPIVYGGDGGPDLAVVCEQLAMSESEFIELHTAREYEVDMLGFTPGFAYVGGLDERLNVPRLTTPRANVPAGSVGIADGRTGLYALQGPGGWPLIGRTTLVLFDSTSDELFTLRPGSTVRFVAVTTA